ncbi:unnamed protein product, partial [Hymenolepis diminuta]
SAFTTTSLVATNSCLSSKSDPRSVIQNTVHISPHHSTQSKQLTDFLFAQLLFIQLVHDQPSALKNPASVRQNLRRKT